jgi:DNA-directed RNA polymerase subunit RPC12/RpoP
MLKLRNAVYKFMYGRYGHDKLNYFIIIFAMALSIVSALFFKGNPFISLFVYGLLIVSMLRMLSRKASKRRKENDKFMTLTRPFRSSYKLFKKNVTDKDHRYYQCPQCGQKVRVPRGRGKVEISCPSCRTKFSRRS